MSRLTRYLLACAVVVVLASVAAAQQKPEPVIRIGDWVEIGNEAFMNIIAGGDIRYNTAHNMDFESDVRDTPPSRDPFNTVNINQQDDALFFQGRLGADFRHQKNFLFQILFQWEGAMDGNLVDDRHNATSPGGGTGAVTEDESTNLERMWMEYKFEGTPVRIRVGADLWFSDQGGMIADDDPRFALYLDLPGDLEIGAWAVLQTSSLRLGLTNDHDFWYYVFHASYKGAKPMVLALDAVYFRDRSNISAAGGDGTGAFSPFVGQKTDTVLIMPSFSGTWGALTLLLQPMVIFGSVDGGLVGGSQPDYDVFAWGGVGYLEANLGVVRPFIGVVIGSADDDENDNDLNGFAPFPQNEITIITGTSFFGHLDTATAIGSRDIVTPARNNSAGGGGGMFGAGATQEFGHSVGNPYNERIANFMHPGTRTTYSNPGTLLIPVGVKIAAARGHEVSLAYLHRRMMKSDLVDNGLGVDVANMLYHEGWLQWQWTLSRHFDIRLHGSVLIPGAGAKDIARASEFGDCTAARLCDGDEIGFHGQARFRAQF